MQNHIYYIKYALQFADMQIPELVTVFNSQVGNTGWTGMRAYHDQALIDEFQRRGIDVSAVYDGKAITFAHPVKYDIADNRLTTIGWDSLSISEPHPCRLLLATVDFIIWFTHMHLFIVFVSENS